MRITLRDVNHELVELCRDQLFGTQFERHHDIHVEHGNVFDAKVGKFDTLITPGNSFGFMDSGFSALVLNSWGAATQELVQKAIDQIWGGELPVGNAVMLSENPRGVKLVYAPTMRVPMDIRGTVNAYSAIREGLRHAWAHKASHVMLPAMGAGAGMLPKEIFVKQFVAAVNDYLDPPNYKTWREARMAHWSMVGP